MSSRTYRFGLVLNRSQIYGYYQGELTAVQVRTDCGLRLQLDLFHFRSYFQHSGLTGRFELTTDAAGKFVQLNKIN